MISDICTSAILLQIWSSHDFLLHNTNVCFSQKIYRYLCNNPIILLGMFYCMLMIRVHQKQINTPMYCLSLWIYLMDGRTPEWWMQHARHYARQRFIIIKFKLSLFWYAKWGIFILWKLRCHSLLINCWKVE